MRQLYKIILPRVQQLYKIILPRVQKIYKIIPAFLILILSGLFYYDFKYLSASASSTTSTCNKCSICENFCYIFKTHKYSSGLLFAISLISLKRLNYLSKTAIILIEMFATYKIEESNFLDWASPSISIISLAIDICRNYPKQSKCNGQILKIYSANPTNPRAVALKVACEMTCRRCDIVEPDGQNESNENGPNNKSIWTDEDFDHINVDRCDRTTIHRLFLAHLAKTKFAPAEPEMIDIELAEHWLNLLQQENEQQIRFQLEALFSQSSRQSQFQKKPGCFTRFFDGIKNYFNYFCCNCCNNCCNCCSTITINIQPSEPSIIGNKLSSIDILAAIELCSAINQQPTKSNSFPKTTIWLNNVLLSNVAYAKRFIHYRDLRGKHRTLAEILYEQKCPNGRFHRNGLDGVGGANFGDQQQQVRQSSIQNSAVSYRASTFPLTLSCRTDHSFGFSIRGGSEYDLPLFIKKIADEGPAAESKMKVGDQLLEIDGVLTDGMTHERAIGLIRGRESITLKLKGMRPDETIV